MPCLVELRLNSLHRQQRTPELDDVLIVGRGDQCKLVLGFALQHRENRFAELDVALSRNPSHRRGEIPRPDQKGTDAFS